MRILCWSHLFYPNIGGIEVLLMRLLPALRDRGHDILVVASHGIDTPAEATFEGIPVRRFDFRHAIVRKNPVEIARLRAAVAALKRQFAPDLVHLHFPGPDAFFHTATRDAHAAPTLLTFHTPPAEHRLGPGTLVGELIESAAWVTAVSRATLEEARAVVPGLAARSSLVYNGLPWPAPAPAPLGFGPPHLLAMGRMAAEKGFDVAIDAFAAVSARWPGCRLTLAGEGSARPALERQAAALGLSDRVRFTGWVHPDAIAALLNESTIVLAPARWNEPFCLVAVEAAQMARPVVASAIAGLKETVLHGETGLLVPAGDAAALASAVSTLLDDPALAIRLGEAGRRRAAETFGLEACVDGYARLYDRLAPAAGVRAVGSTRA
jgi:glycogen(starch) synthase